VNESDEGKPAFLSEWEKAASQGGELKSEAPWDSPFARQWLALEPPFADQDLRAAVYVSRDHLPIVLAADQFSSEAADAMASLLAIKSQISTTAAGQFKTLTLVQRAAVLERILQRAKNETSWGTPNILYACLTVAEASIEQLAQLTPALMPLLADKAWAKPIIEHWQAQANLPPRVKKALNPSKLGGQ
jgi:predicted KAP-like P-loop ATPase